MIKYISFSLAILFLTSCASHQSAYRQLQLRSVEKLSAPDATDVSVSNEISGTAVIDKKELYVTDEVKDHYIYQLEKIGQTKDYRLTTWLDLNQIEDFKLYVKDLKKITDTPLDLEGMAVCESGEHKTIFLINERVRDILKIEVQNKQASFMSIGKPIQENVSKHLDSIKSATEVNKNIKGIDGKDFLFARDYTQTPLFGKTGAQFDNAGFEGIAADCATQTLYIAKERQPRYMIQSDFNGNLKDLFVVPESTRQFHAVKNPFSGEGSYVTEPDMSDLFFLSGINHLFVLERNSGEISEFDPAKINDKHEMELVARYDYSPWEFIYNEVTKINMVAPFGMAETLTVEGGSKKTFHIGFDNGGENKLNSKGFSVLGCGNLKDDQNCLQKDALNAVVLTLQEK